MARYAKVDRRIWNDAHFRSLSERGKLVFLFALTHPSLTMLGAMRATVPGLAAELDMPLEAFTKAFGEALAKGVVKHDPQASCLWLPNFLKYNKPESPNVVRAWPDAFDLIPECDLKSNMLERLKAFIEGLSEGFREAFREAFGKPSESLPEALAESVTVTVTETGTVKDISEAKASSPRRDADGGNQPTEIIDFWNAATYKKLPQAKSTTKRKQLIKTRLREPGWLNDFQAACRYVADTAFYRGDNERGWVASIDFLLRPDKATELAEKAAQPAPIDRFGKPMASAEQRPKSQYELEAEAQIAEQRRLREQHSRGEQVQ